MRRIERDFDVRTYRYDYIVTYPTRKFNPKNSIKFGNFPESIGSKNELEENVPYRPHRPVVAATKNIVSLRGGRRSHPTWQSPPGSFVKTYRRLPRRFAPRNDSSFGGVPPQTILTRRQIVVEFYFGVCYNCPCQLKMQDSYIGNTTASQAVKAGSTPVSCSKRKHHPAGGVFVWHRRRRESNPLQ